MQTGLRHKKQQFHTNEASSVDVRPRSSVLGKHSYAKAPQPRSRMGDSASAHRDVRPQEHTEMSSFSSTFLLSARNGTCS
jgi:hypothetical protein